MKMILKSLLMASLLLTTSAASAQRTVQDIEDWMSSNISRVLDAKIDVQKSLGQERNMQQEGTPLKWRCDTYSFTLPKKRRELLDAMVQAFEANGHDNPNCYSINSLTETTDGDIYGKERNLMIGENVNRYVTIGKDYNNYLNINVLDAADTTKTHRYAYALEWREARKGAVDVRYIVTYGKIPSATTSIITSQDWPSLDFGNAKVLKGQIKKNGNIRVRWRDKEYSLDSLREVMRGVEQHSESLLDLFQRKGQDIKKKADDLRKRFVDKDNRVIVTWSDTLDHDTDPVTDLIQRLQQGKNITADDLLCDDNVLLVFSQMKKQFNEGNNMELNAISIYSLCKRARETGLFNYDGDAKELLRSEIQEMVDGLVRLNGFKSERGYLELAIKELDKIESKPWK